MACCKIESGTPFLVTPSRTPSQNVDLGSFADLLDHALANLREVLVKDHTRRLHASGLIAQTCANRSAWEILPDSHTSSCRQDAAPNPAAERGTQTQVDWTWPGMPFTWIPVPSGDMSKSAVDVQSDVTLKVDVQSNESLQENCHVEDQSKPRGSDKAAHKEFVHMESADLKTRNEEKMQRIAQQVDTNAWSRMLLRSRKAPLDMIDAFMGFVIIANTISLGISSDTRQWEKGWLVIDSIFASFFIVELLIKVCYLGPAGYLWSADHHWAWFETALVILSVVEIVITFSIADSSTLKGSSIFRVIRLVRLVKIARICRLPAASDLVMMVAGIVGGSRTLVSAILMVVFPLFVFALVMRETLGAEFTGSEAPGSGNGATSFDTLPKACFNTFRCLVVEDCADETGRPIFVLVAEAYGWSYSFVYALSLVLLKFGLYNVIVAIFVEQTVRAAKHNATFQKRARLNDQYMFQERSLEMAELAYSLKKGIPQARVSCHLTMDEIQSLELTNDDFNALCKHAEFKELLSALDVAEEDHLDLFDTLDVDGGGTLDLGEIVSGIAKLRGDARKSDIVAVILLAKHLNKCLAEFKEETTGVLEGQRRQLSSIQKALHPIFDAHPHNC